MSVLRVGILGAGPMGRLHAKTVARVSQRDGSCRLTCIIDRHLGRAADVAAEFGGQAMRDPDVGLADVDVVIVCVPTSAHFAMTQILLDRGHDVLVEKPLAASVAEAKRLEELARIHGRILQVGHVEWYNRGWREAMRIAGKPSLIEVDRLHPPSDRGLDIDVVQDFMLHDLDWITRFLAEDAIEVAAQGRCVRNNKLDEAEAQLRFQSGCEVRLRASRVYSERCRRVRVEGDQAIATADLLTRRVIGATLADENAPDPLEAQWLEFLDCVVRRNRPDADASVGVAALEIVDRVRSSIAQDLGGTVRADDSALGR